MRLAPITPGDLHPKDNYNIVENLPTVLRDASQKFRNPAEQHLFLFSALGVLSGCLPNYLGHYNGCWVSPHLYLFVLAPYGTGKGTMSFARYLATSIHETKRARAISAFAAYKSALETAKKRKKGDADISASTAISEPANEMLILPADTSKSAIIDALHDNNGHGIIFETEGDTLTAALKQDYAAFLDILLKAFHHEVIAYMRKTNREQKEIAEPRLAMVLSSTYEQYLHFIKSAENGLVSRFAYYLLPENKSFLNVFAIDKSDLKNYFTEMGKTIEVIYNDLYKREKPITFHLTQEQEETFYEHFGTMKSEAAGLEGSVNRLGLITFRIAMILSYFRHPEIHEGTFPEEYLMCYNKDFTNALAISQILLDNSEIVHAMLPPIAVKNKPGNHDIYFAALPDEFETKEALKIAKECRISTRTAQRFLQCDERIERLGQGKYKKK